VWRWRLLTVAGEGGAKKFESLCMRSLTLRDKRLSRPSAVVRHVIVASGVAQAAVGSHGAGVWLYSCLCSDRPAEREKMVHHTRPEGIHPGSGLEA